MERRWVDLARWVALAVWLSVPVVALASQALAGRLVWGVAVAGLPLFIVLVGYHRWRRICPLAWFNQLPTRLGYPGTRRAPRWIEQRYYYIPLAAFTLGLWLRLVWTNGDGVAIALFFVGISVLALAVGALTTGKTWCNYVCPVSFIEKIYTEPIGLRETPNSQCTRCTACKTACPDINAENAYWKEIRLPAKRLAYFAYPGLVVGFYTYYFLQSGTWDYYFSGAWTDEPGVISRAFTAGFDPASAGFFFLPVIPRAVAALATLVSFALASCVLFAALERVVTRVLRWNAEQVRNLVFALAAFAAFVAFYSFAGQPTLRKVEWLPTFAAILTIGVATISLARRVGRTSQAFAEQSVARNLLKRWPWLDPPPTDMHDVILVHQSRGREREHAYSEVLTAYHDALRDSLEDGLVTQADIQRLTVLRDRLHIRPADNERIMQQLAEVEPTDSIGLTPDGSIEKRLQLIGYARALQAYLEEMSGNSLAAAESRRLRHLQVQYGVTAQEHADVLADLLGRSGRAAEALEALVQQVRQIETSLALLEHDRSSAIEFVCELLQLRRERLIDRTAAIVPSFVAQEVGDLQPPPQSTSECLRRLLEDSDPFIRAGALAALRARGHANADLLRQMAVDEHELVRETAADSDSVSTLDKLLALRAIPLFTGLQSVSLFALARASTPERFAPGDALCVEGEPGQDVLVLLAGEVEVSHRVGPTEQMLRVQGAGEVIGEMSVLDPAPRSATVRATGEGVLALRLAGSAFRDVVAADGEVAASVIHELVVRLRDPADRSASLASAPTRAR